VIEESLEGDALGAGAVDPQDLAADSGEPELAAEATNWWAINDRNVQGAISIASNTLSR